MPVFFFSFWFLRKTKLSLTCICRALQQQKTLRRTFLQKDRKLMRNLKWLKNNQEQKYHRTTWFEHYIARTIGPFLQRGLSVVFQDSDLASLKASLWHFVQLCGNIVRIVQQGKVHKDELCFLWRNLTDLHRVLTSTRLITFVINWRGDCEHRAICSTLVTDLTCALLEESSKKSQKHSKTMWKALPEELRLLQLQRKVHIKKKFTVQPMERQMPSYFWQYSVYLDGR